MSNNLKTPFFYTLAGFAMIALAGIAPKFAIMLMVVLIAGVFLLNWQQYTPYLSPPVNGKFGG
jgi:hypothetical protein